MFLRQADVPAEYAEFRVLWRDFQNLAPMDIIKLRFPELPSFGGTSPKPFGPVYNDQEVEISNLDTLSRYKEYRAQVYNVLYDISDNQPLRLRVRARLLIHPNDPTGNEFFQDQVIP